MGVAGVSGCWVLGCCWKYIYSVAIHSVALVSWNNETECIAEPASL